MRAKGYIGELIARDYLLAKGHKVLDMNYYSRSGEIDMITYDKSEDLLCFIEVKYYDSNFLDAVFSITPKKRKRLLMTARHYLAFRFSKVMGGRRPDEIQSRFDLMVIKRELVSDYIENIVQI